MADKKVIEMEEKVEDTKVKETKPKKKTTKKTTNSKTKKETKVEEVKSTDDEENYSLDEILDDINGFVVDIGDKEVKEYSKLKNYATSRLEGYGLEYTFRSIKYVIDKKHVTFNQLRSCLFKSKDNNEEVIYDVLEAVTILLEAGLIGSGEVASNDSKKLDDKVNDILEDWRENVGFIGILHILLIDIMEKKHFFMGDQDVKILKLMSYQNNQRDIANQSLLMKIQETLLMGQQI